MRLQHIHIPYLISYPTASLIQSTLVERHLAHKTLFRAISGSGPALARPRSAPRPTVLTFSTPPTYTVGRRYLTRNPFHEAQITYLEGSSPSSDRLASFYTSPRGGDLTYHAPGQLTAYCIIDLRSFIPKITPHDYVSLLEKTIINTCSRLGVPNTTTISDPGVWITNPVTKKATDRKVCALGIHIQRGITSHGIGLNVFDHPISHQSARQSYLLPDSSVHAAKPAPGYLSWGFSRVVACGLEGKSVTWLTREGAQAHLSVEESASVFTQELAWSLGLSSGHDRSDSQNDTAGDTDVDRVTLEELALPYDDLKAVEGGLIV